MKKLISRFSKYDEWGYRNPQFDKLKKVAGTIIILSSTYKCNFLGADNKQ